MGIKIGLIGCGGHGRQRLSKILRNMEDLLILVACSDTDMSSAKATASEDGYLKAYDNYINMLEKEDLDAQFFPHIETQPAAIPGKTATSQN